jgi:hypothetical protein
MIGELCINPETGEVTEAEQEVEATTPNNKTINNKPKVDNVEHLIFNTDFIKNTKPAKKRDDFAQSLVEEVATQNARSIESKARQDALRVLLATACRNKGGLELADILGRLRQHWMKAEMKKKDPKVSGTSEVDTLIFTFNAVMAAVLREVATRINKGEAREWDETLADLRHELQLEVFPKKFIGGNYEEVTMESISFMPEPVAGKVVEDYAGTNPFEM